ncbi:hypothetical protein PFNF54_03717 [Plasmodium falciparum NF54]|uniref:Uncharacterized protein n=1 Tax=Plasmodium falciparum (isolate NF54) TaxID=5843 RepID=W7KD91_PLAFO|nr:hypothetical protein PFNF54_03717 [Plasmodium falciparum NF54]
MYKDIEDIQDDNKNNRKNKKSEHPIEKVIIRVKRRIDDTSIPSIYVKKSNKRICNGDFYKHIDTIIPEEGQHEKNIDCINLFLKHEKENYEMNNLYENLNIEEEKRKRKLSSLKNYEKDLKQTINKLKKYKIINENIQYINLDGNGKGVYKIIDTSHISSI